MYLSSRGGRSVTALALVATFLTTAASLRAQGSDTTAAPAVGQDAPDFTAPGATRYGLLRDPIKLSDFRGKTVILAFFFKARTKG
jgi:peroxiredoxin Q/BCP